MVSIDEVWNWVEWEKYNPETRSGGLFSDYVNTFLRLKAQASGWPEGVTTEEEKDRFLDEFFEQEGVRLVKDDVGFNAGLRQIAKLALNSFWVFHSQL